MREGNDRHKGWHAGDTARVQTWTLTVVLGCSAAAITLAPMVVDSTYDWLIHTTSESAGQAVSGAWMARLGFVLLGLGVIGIAGLRHRQWGLPATAMHMLFGISMVATAAFSTRSWDPAVPYDPTEDLLHSLFATAMGFAFAGGVVFVLVRNHRNRPRRVGLDAIAIAASVLIPLGMSALSVIDGLLQRTMFAIAYCWYITELWSPEPEAGPRVPSMG